jgi:hypothetical protein
MRRTKPKLAPRPMPTFAVLERPVFACGRAGVEVDPAALGMGELTWNWVGADEEYAEKVDIIALALVVFEIVKRLSVDSVDWRREIEAVETWRPE